MSFGHLVGNNARCMVQRQIVALTTNTMNVYSACGRRAYFEIGQLPGDIVPVCVTCLVTLQAHQNDAAYYARPLYPNEYWLKDLRAEALRRLVWVDISQFKPMTERK